MTAHWFYSPHADDEALGMAGSIIQARRDGHDVKLVLVTESGPSPSMVALFAGQRRCHWHTKRHAIAVNLQQARHREFQLSAITLGVPDVRFWNLPEHDDTAGQSHLADQIFDRILLAETETPRAVHHLIGSPHDLYFESPAGNGSHHACWLAAQRAADHGLTVRLHRVYHYSVPREQRQAPIVLHLDDAMMEQKRAALAVYRRWAPSLGFVGFGFHSVPSLFIAADADPREFMDPVYDSSMVVR